MLISLLLSSPAVAENAAEDSTLQSDRTRLETHLGANLFSQLTRKMRTKKNRYPDSL